MGPPRVFGVVKFRNWRPMDEESWPVVLAALQRWMVDGKALLYNGDGVPVDVGTLATGDQAVTLDAKLEVYDKQLWATWASAAR